MADNYLENRMAALEQRKKATGANRGDKPSRKPGRVFYTRPGSSIRPANPDDAPFIARGVLEALGWESFEKVADADVERAVAETTEVCRRDDTLYSYRNAQVAMMGSMRVGLLVSYPGADYHQVRERTFSLLPSFQGVSLEEMADETQAGEYYIDSLAVIPSRRRQGLGRRLLESGIARAREMSLLPVLLVDPENPKALSLYTSLGFMHEGEIFAFGHLYWRMVRPL